MQLEVRTDLARVYNRQLIIEFQTRFCKSIKGLVMDEHLVVSFVVVACRIIVSAPIQF